MKKLIAVATLAGLLAGCSGKSSPIAVPDTRTVVTVRIGVNCTGVPWTAVDTNGRLAAKINATFDSAYYISCHAGDTLYAYTDTINSRYYVDWGDTIIASLTPAGDTITLWYFLSWGTMREY